MVDPVTATLLSAGLEKPKEIGEGGKALLEGAGTAATGIGGGVAKAADGIGGGVKNARMGTAEIEKAKGKAQADVAEALGNADAKRIEALAKLLPHMEKLSPEMQEKLLEHIKPTQPAPEKPDFNTALANGLLLSSGSIAPLASGLAGYFAGQKAFATPSTHISHQKNHGSTRQAPGPEVTLGA